jgi:DNA repair protein RadC
MAESTLFAGAVTAVLAHNHPFGVAQPSDEDRRATAVVGAALANLGVALHCHYIVAGVDFCVIE